VVIALVGLIFGIRAISDSSDKATTKSTTQANAGATTGATDNGGNTGETPAQTATPQKIPLTADMVRIVDPPESDRVDTGEAKFTVDNDPDTAWKTQGFKQPNFGGRKLGMGVLINLKTPRTLSEVQVETSAPGVRMDVRTGTADYGDNWNGDKKIVQTFKKVNDGDTEKTDGTRAVFNGFNEDTKYQYVLVWLSELPLDKDDGRYRINVENIEVYGS
jgi:eukaryotic-like serine/threonine-protein kinase